MTFPVETEATIRRRILDICREQTRNVVDITRELALMMDNLSDGKPKDCKDNYGNMVKIMDTFDGTKKKLLEEVASVGNLLGSRDDFISGLGQRVPRPLEGLDSEGRNYLADSRTSSHRP